MLLLLLACAEPKPDPADDTAAIDDTGADTDSADTDTDTDTDTDSDTDTDTDTDSDTDTDTDSDTDTDTDPTPLLDECVTTGALVADWSVALPGFTGTPGRIAWEAGTLAVLTDAADAVHVFDLASPPAASGLAARWSFTATDALAGLALPTGTIAVGDGRTLRVLDRASGSAVATAEAEGRITALAADGAGVFGGTGQRPFRWDGADLTHADALGLSDTRAVGRTAEGFWTAADATTPTVAFSDGSATVETAVTAFGDAVDVVARPGGGAWVLGGPESYAWFATFDATGALVTSTQTYVGIPQATGSPASAYAWSSFLDLGFIVIGDDGTFGSLYTPGSEDVTGLAADPDGRWLLTAHADGTLSRWSCVP